MSAFWKRLLDRVFASPTPQDAPPPSRLPPQPPPPPPAVAYPDTYRAAAHDGVRSQVFDPALKHLPRAFRPSDPAFTNPDDARRWVELRRRATDHVLRQIAESPWGDRVVLRGSRLLKAWIGDAAREPGDLDWVVDPPDLDSSDPRAIELCGGLTDAVFSRSAPAGIAFDRASIAADEIWTYERAAGRRVVLPWRAAGLPGGAVQVDVVFGEPLPEPARRDPLPLADGGCVCVRAATPALSLAWKLLWLSTDWYPQGKDLYDAVLLAERFALPAGLLERTLREAGPLPLNASAFVEGWRVDWENFRAEYPWVGDGPVGEWLTRLAEALKPTFTESWRLGENEQWPYGRPYPAVVNPDWLTLTVLAVARGIDTDSALDGLPILADALQEAGCEEEVILNHCRAFGPHAGDCWVVDLILGKR